MPASVHHAAGAEGTQIADSLLMIQLARNIRMTRRFASYCADTHVGGVA
jgi:hypothetical protein